MGPGGSLEVRRVEDERARLEAAEPAVEADQLLEGAALFELGVVEAPHHDVGDMLEAVGAQQVLWRGGRERRERVLALDAAVREVVRAAGAERDRPVLGRADEQPADVGVRAEGGHELRVPRLDLLERQPAALLHQVDESEVARAEHDDVPVGDVVLGPLGLLSRRLADGVADHRALLVPAGDSGDLAAREGALDELVEAVPVALLEGRALRLPVVGEDDDLVRPRGVAARSLDLREAGRRACAGPRACRPARGPSGAPPRRSSRTSRRRQVALASCR